MFKNARTLTKQGDIGEARAIYEYTKMGFGVSRTIFDSEKYDLIVDRNGVLKRVQVKTTRYKTPHNIYQVMLRTSGGNKSQKTVYKRKDSDYDELFVLCEDGDCYMIPIEFLNTENTINLGKKFKDFKV